MSGLSQKCHLIFLIFHLAKVAHFEFLSEKLLTSPDVGLSKHVPLKCLQVIGTESQLL